MLSSKVEVRTIGSSSCVAIARVAKNRLSFSRALACMRTSTILLYLFAVCWRVFITVSTRTFFQPDEFYQSLEVAHYAVFGYGHLTWEWKANPPIRSFFYPSLYTPAYWILKFFAIDSDVLVIIAPKILHGLLAALTDIGTFHLGKLFFGDRTAFVAYFLSIVSTFHFYCLSRTFSNSIETSLTSLALCFWPWDDRNIKKRYIVTSLSLAAISCMIRPTSTVLWIYLACDLLYRQRRRRAMLGFLILSASCIGIISVSAICIIDSLYFEQLTITPINFLKTNLSSVSLFYGIDSWHFYLTQGIPVICGTCIPFFVLGVVAVRRHISAAPRLLLGMIVWTTAIYSLMGHKEWRFVLPLSPAIHAISSKAIVDIYDKEMKGTQDDSSKNNLRPTLPIKTPHMLLLLSGLLPAIYLSYFHGKGQIDVMHYLRNLAPGQELKSIGFLMPCHSTPAHAYLHRPYLAESGRMWALSCEPPLDGQALTTYQSQTDVFYESPYEYIVKHFPQNVSKSFPASPLAMSNPGSSRDVYWWHEWPSHLALFGALLEGEEGQKIYLLLRRLGYRKVWSGGNGLDEDSRRRGTVQVWSVTS